MQMEWCNNNNNNNNNDNNNKNDNYNNKIIIIIKIIIITIIINNNKSFINKFLKQTKLQYVIHHYSYKSYWQKFKRSKYAIFQISNTALYSLFIIIMNNNKYNLYSPEIQMF